MAVSFWKLKTAYLRWSKKNPQPKKIKFTSESKGFIHKKSWGNE